MDKRKNYLDLAFRSIYLSYSECYIFGQIYNDLCIQESAPCAANFRDTFFHYRKLYESDFNDEYITQYESIVEHANRLFKDSIVQLTQVLISSLSKMMVDITDQETYMKLYDSKVELKKIQLDLRGKSLEIQRPLDDNDLKNSPIKTITQIITEIKSIGLYDLLKKFNAEYKK